jgi:hypothetical protein
MTVFFYIEGSGNGREVRLGFVLGMWKRNGRRSLNVLRRNTVRARELRENCGFSTMTATLERSCL